MDEQVKTFNRSVIFVQSVRRGAKSIPIGNIYESLQTLWLEAFLLEYAKLLSNFGGEDAKSSNENGKASRNSDRPNQRTEPLGLVRQNPDQTCAFSVLAWGAESWLLLRLHIAGMVSVDPAQPQTGNRAVGRDYLENPTSARKMVLAGRFDRSKWSFLRALWRSNPGVPPGRELRIRRRCCTSCRSASSRASSESTAGFRGNWTRQRQPGHPHRARSVKNHQNCVNEAWELLTLLKAHQRLGHQTHPQH